MNFNYSTSFNSAYRTSSQYVSQKYKNSIAWIKDTYSHVYAKFPKMGDLTQYAQGSYSGGKAFVNKTYTQISKKLPELQASAKQRVYSSYKSGEAFIKNTYAQASIKLPETISYVREQAYHTYTVGKTFVWTHKIGIVSGGILLYTLKYIGKNQSNKSTIHSTSRIAKTTITTPTKAPTNQNTPPKPAAQVHAKPVITNLIVPKTEPVIQNIPPTQPVQNNPKPKVKADEGEQKAKIESLIDVSKPIAVLNTTLNVGLLSIKIPSAQPRPPNVTLTFCIDTSSSMDHFERMPVVKKVMNAVLDHAQGIINSKKNASIKIAVVGFNGCGKIIVSGISLTPNRNSPNDNDPINVIKNELAKELNPNGTTDILNGLDLASKECKKMAKLDGLSSHTVILLTDGESDINSGRLARIQNRLKKINANLFAIGVGNDHDNKILKSILINAENYIDTSSGEATIESSIFKIYTQAIASFNLVLTSPQLPLGSWRITNASQRNESGQTKFLLGSLSEGQAFYEAIQIYASRLPHGFDLSKVTFTLAYDAHNTLTLPWNATTTINPNTALEAGKKLGFYL